MLFTVGLMELCFVVFVTEDISHTALVHALQGVTEDKEDEDDSRHI